MTNNSNDTIYSSVSANINFYENIYENVNEDITPATTKMKLKLKAKSPSTTVNSTIGTSISDTLINENTSITEYNTLTVKISKENITYVKILNATDEVKNISTFVDFLVTEHRNTKKAV